VYRAEIDLSAFTNTDDAEGERSEVAVANPPTMAAIKAVLATLTGTVMQKPPAYSALKINGQRAYKLIRRGEDVDIPPRPVRIDAITIDAYAWPILTVTVTCGKGTYIRSLARQIGEGLGTGGSLRALRRTAVGEYRIEGALPLDALPEILTEADLLPVPPIHDAASAEGSLVGG
ncbi:MAG: tRNA pseudouridine(55) synthase TruB, partial [Planctomycetota bacterium]